MPIFSDPRVACPRLLLCQSNTFNYSVQDDEVFLCGSLVLSVVPRDSEKVLAWRELGEGRKKMRLDALAIFNVNSSAFAISYHYAIIGVAFSPVHPATVPLHIHSRKTHLREQFRLFFFFAR